MSAMLSFTMFLFEEMNDRIPWRGYRAPRSTAPPVHAARTPHTSNRSRLAVVDPGQTDERVEDYSNQAVSDNVFLGVRGDWLFGCCSMLL